MVSSSIVLALGTILSLCLPSPAFSSVATGKEAFSRTAASPLRSVIPKHLPRFAWNREGKPLKIPLVINVFLAGLDYNANENVYTVWQEPARSFSPSPSWPLPVSISSPPTSYLLGDRGNQRPRSSKNSIFPSLLLTW